MNIGGHQVAVCSWSLQPRDMGELVAKLKQIGLSTVQLGLLELVQLDDKRKHQELGQLRAAGIDFTGGMISFPGEDYSTIAQIRRTGGFVPDEQWPLRRRLAEEAARLARELGMKTVTAHVGFVPPHDDGRYVPIRDRIRELAEKFGSFGIDLLMETGQESAEELLAFLNDLSAPNVGINFDPANMILYGAGDPMAAVATLGRHIRHVHAKDAIPSSKPGQEWGKEVPFGTGNVKPAEFLKALHKVGYVGPLAIEREAGNDRVGDVRFAVDSLRQAQHQSDR
jgi:sugar phosphate isomerase/epimerase